MSLKAFHVFFVTVSILLSVGVAGWALREYQRSGGTQNLVFIIVSVAAGGVLLLYSKWFVRKLKDVSYL